MDVWGRARVPYEKAEIIHRIALDMQGSAEGLSLEDISKRYTDEPLSRRTAERLRDAVQNLFEVEHANPGEPIKRWRIRNSRQQPIADITVEDLATLATAIALSRREGLGPQADRLERITAKLKAQLHRATITRLEPDVEALMEAEGIAMRPGPRPQINVDILSALRTAILGMRKVRIRYHYRIRGQDGQVTVRPYGILYGIRHYLVAWAENSKEPGVRNFSLSDIQALESLDETFTRDEGFSLADYAQRSFGVYQEEPFEVAWQFDKVAAPRAREFAFHPTQTFEELDDGSLVVRFKAGGTVEMAWHLEMWGEHVTVMEPKDFASEARRLREKALP